MTLQERQNYLGIATDPRETSRFKVRATVGLFIITLATVVMFTEQQQTIYKAGAKISKTARKVRRSGRRIKNLFE